MWVSIILLALVVPASCCTTIAFGKKATVDGTPMLTFNADAASADYRMAYVPAKEHKDGKRPVYPFLINYPRQVGDRAATYASQEKNGVMQKQTTPLGYIPQVSRTYAYWEALFPIMNEKGVAFGESTCWGKIRAAPREVGGKGPLFYVHELMAVALERCDTARCAIRTMGYWAEKEGFYGEDAKPSEGGEILTVIDGDEAWFFHVMADYHGSAVWAAQRVPDDHASVAANNFIIRGIDFDDHRHANFMWSNNTLRTARELVDRGEADAWCADAETFDFLRCFGPDLRKDWYDPGYGPKVGDPFYTTLRMWRVRNLIAPAPGFEQPTNNAFDLPFSFIIDDPVNVKQIMDVKSDQLKGTAFDLGKDALGGPFEDPNRFQGGDAMALEVPGKWARAISLLRTAYSVIAQTKHSVSDAPDLFWFTMHQPATSVYVPFFAKATKCHDSYTKGSNFEYDRSSAWWVFSFVSNYMRIAWKEMGEKYVFPKRQQLQADVLAKVGTITSNLTEEQVDLQGKVVSQWASLSDFLVAAFNNGFLNVPSLAGQFGYPKEWLAQVGFSMSIMPRKVEADAAASDLAAEPSNWKSMFAFGFGGLASGLFIGTAGTLVALGLGRRSRVGDTCDYGHLPGA